MHFFIMLAELGLGLFGSILLLLGMTNSHYVKDDDYPLKKTQWHSIKYIQWVRRLLDIFTPPFLQTWIFKQVIVIWCIQIMSFGKVENI